MSEAETDDHILAELKLLLTPGVGPRLRRNLIDRFGSPAAVLQASRADLTAVERVGPKIASALAAARDASDAEAELEVCRSEHIQILIDGQDGYPALLRELPDPPGLLFLKGEILPIDALGVAIVGTRHASRYGLAQAERLAGSLARAGFTIVSGLARGIDAAAHRAALAAGGRTLAVLGSGVLRMFPPEHEDLARQVAEHGAVLSEFPPRMAPQAGFFPQRNRIISGLSLGVIVVEASDRSGALITARHASEQGREVFAVPGPVDSRLSRGCHRLLREGAKLVETADDVLEELGPLATPAARVDGPAVHHPAELTLNDQEQRVLAAIDTAPRPIDSVIVGCGLPASQVLATLSVLEMRRLVKRVGGTLVVRA